MAKNNFSPIKNGLVTHAVTDAATSLTVPDGGANYAEGYVRTNSVVETRDGTAPTTTKGTQWAAGDIITLRSPDEVNGFQVIRENASNAATIDFQFYNKVPGMN